MGNGRGAPGRRVEARGAGRIEGRIGNWYGAIAAALVPPALAAALDQAHHELNLTSTALLFLAAVVAVARLGGLLSALAAALWASLLLNYYFVLPLHSAAIANANDVIALIVFAVVALTVASVVDLAARQSRRAARANSEAETLNALSVAVLHGDGALPVLLEQLRATFDAASVSLLQQNADAPDAAAAARRGGGPDAWHVVSSSGTGPPVRSPGEADTVVPVGADGVLALHGRVLKESDQHVLSAFTAQATAALERRDLARASAHAATLEAAEKMRTALLTAVSHDLRAPLAAARTAVSTLADPELDVTPADRAELLDIAEGSLAKLTRLVEDLLDMSRLQAGALKPRLTPVYPEEVIGPALESLDEAADRVHIQPPDPGIPPILADGPLLERVVANLISNALKHTNAEVVVDVVAEHRNQKSTVSLRVIDHGPGIPVDARELVFRPFQRLGDRDNTAGVGLGLALARGLAESMGGALTPEDTPGGGLTMVLTLPTADGPPAE